MKTRPISITILSLLYIVAGCVGLAYHAPEWKHAGANHYEIVWISALRLLAVIAGAAMLRKQNWARWVAVAWIAFHVVVSVFNGWGQVAFHAVFLAVVLWVIMRRPAAEYFHSAQPSHSL